MNKQSMAFGKKDAEKAAEQEYDTMKDRVMNEAKNTFKPEFINRIDEMLVFRPLLKRQMYAIVELMLKRVQTQLTEQEIELKMPDAAKDFLIEKGINLEYGARPLRREIQRRVEDPLAEGLLQGKYNPRDLIEAIVEDDELKLIVRPRFELLSSPAAPEAALTAGGSSESTSGDIANS
jgi:ATP-dependent Clp protease ATP-binding subunit ClpC